MRLSARLVITALVLSLLAASLTAGILLARTFREDLASETGRGLDAYHMYTAALKASIEAFGGLDSEEAFQRAVRITTRYMTNAPMVAVTDGAGRLMHDNFSEDNAPLLAFMPKDAATYALVELEGRQYQLIRGGFGALGRDFSVYFGWDITRVYVAAREQAVYAMALLLCMAALLAALLAAAVRVNLRPLRRLEGAARQLSQGDYAARAQVVHPGDEVGSVALAFNHMADAVEEHVARLERQDAQQKQFIADMAHELKTPMTGIIGYADLLRRSHVDERQRQTALSAIVAQGERLERMAFKLLAIAGLDGGRVPDMQPASVQAMFNQARDAARHLSDAAGVAIRADIGIDTLLCDSDLITSLIENLLTNAVKASPPGSEVVFEARDNLLRVTDHGAGIPKEHLPHITEAFYMADASRARAQQGAGLGLALCRRIAALHRAELIIQSEEGKGTEATVLFTGRIQQSDKPETPAAYHGHDRTNTKEDHDP